MAGSGRDKKLSYYQERAIPALLASPTIPEAATAAGVGERTLRRWLAEDHEFITRYRAVRRQIVEASISRLQKCTTQAVEALQRNLTCGLPSTEVRAAQIILEQATKGVELYSLVEELAELERYVKEDNNASNYR
jgi:hypothetical protein